MRAYIVELDGDVCPRKGCARQPTRLRQKQKITYSQGTQ